MVSISKMFCTKMLNQAAPEIKGHRELENI